MIHVSSLLRVADNSGVRTVKCIKILGGSFVKTASIGGLIVVSIQSLKPKYSNLTKLKKGDICYGVIARTKKKIICKDGSVFKFNSNVLFLLDKTKKAIGTRLTGVVVESLRRRKIMKTISISAQFF